MRRIFFACVLAGVASPVAAQPTPWSSDRLTAGWTFTPAAVFGAMWDSNVTVRQEGNPEVADVVGLLRPRGEVDFNGKRTRFSAGYAGTLEAHRTLDELTRYDQRGRLQARYALTPRLEVSTRHSFTMTPTTDQLELAGLPFTRLGSRMFDANGGFAYALSRRATLDAAYSFQWVDFDRDPRFARLTGGHSHAVRSSMGYDVTSRLGVGASWEYRHTLINGGENISDTQHLFGQVTYQVARHTVVGAAAGLAYLRVAATDETRTGPALRADVTHTAARATVTGRYERMFVPVFGIGGISANETMHGGVHVPIGSGRVFWSGGVTHRRTQPLAFEGFVETSAWWTQTSVGWFVTRWLRAEAFYADARQSSFSRGRVDRTRVGLQFVTSTPVRIQ